MKNDLLINDITKKWLNAYISRPSSALLIDSPSDSNIGVQISEHIHQFVVGSKSNPIIPLSSQNSTSIGIDDVRLLQKSLALSANNSNGISRIAVVNNSELMTIEAQNALLKLIEELPKRTILILICSNKENILGTVISRCFLLPVLPIEEAKAIKYAKSLGVELEYAKKAYMLSEGRSSLYQAIIKGEGYELITEIEVAKAYLKASVYERQTMLKTILDKNHDISLFISALKVTTKAGMRNSKSLNQKLRWKHSLESVIEAEKLIKVNVSPKLALLGLSVSS